MSAVTDTNKIRKDDPADPDKCMVYYYYKLVSDDTSKICGECKKGLRGCVGCKKELVNALEEFLAPIRAKREYYVNNPKEVDEILMRGNEKAREKAKEVMARVRKNMKIDYFGNK